jgi:hypothetical protein
MHEHMAAVLQGDWTYDTDRVINGKITRVHMAECSKCMRNSGLYAPQAGREMIH